MDNIKSFGKYAAEKKNDNSFRNCVEALEEMIDEIKSGKLKCDSLLILHLEDSKDIDQYNYGFSAVNLHSSEMISLMRITESLVINQMNLFGED